MPALNRGPRSSNAKDLTAGVGNGWTRIRHTPGGQGGNVSGSSYAERLRSNCSGGVLRLLRKCCNPLASALVESHVIAPEPAARFQAASGGGGHLRGHWPVVLFMIRV